MKNCEHTPSSLPPLPHGFTARIGYVLLMAPRMPVVWVMRGYRAVISPLYGDVCKYYPSCSKYALDAFEVTGLIRGTALTVWRLVRCNPFSRGGVDYVPGSVLERRSTEFNAKKNGTMVPDPSSNDATAGV